MNVRKCISKLYYNISVKYQWNNPEILKKSLIS